MIFKVIIQNQTDKSHRLFAEGMLGFWIIAEDYPILKNAVRHVNNLLKSNKAIIRL